MATATAYSPDVATLDAIIHAMYEVISGPAGQARDWARFRNLYPRDGRLIPVISVPGEPRRPRMLSPEEYIERVEAIFAEEDFWELEVERKTETFGAIAHVLSSYESRRAPDGPAFERGTNSVQLINDGSRWWIVSVMWSTPRKE